MQKDSELQERYKQLGHGNARERQDFLDELDLEDATPYLRRVRYNQKLDQSGRLMGTLPTFRSLIGIKNIKSIVEVYPDAFNSMFLPFIDDFLSALIDHEGHHAREIYESPSIIWKHFSLSEPRCFRNREFGAYRNQIEMIKEKRRNCSKEMLLLLDANYSYCLS